MLSKEGMLLLFYISVSLLSTNFPGFHGTYSCLTLVAFEIFRSQTTKGIWLAKAQNIEPCTLVMDLEGTDGRERGEVMKMKILTIMIGWVGGNLNQYTETW